MSASAHAAHAPAAGSHELEESKFQIYVQIAMLLAVITGIEIITVYLPFAVPADPSSPIPWWCSRR